MKKKMIEIYAEIKNKDVDLHNDANENAGTGCGCGCSLPEESLETIVRKIEEKYHDLYEIKLINPKDESREKIMTTLNTVLSNSGESFTLKESSYDFAIPKLLPLIVSDGKIVSVNTIPNEIDFHEAIQSGKRIRAKAGCC